MYLERAGASHTLADIAKLVDGELAGDGSRAVAGVCSIEEPRPDCISFVRERNPALASRLIERTQLPALILASELRGAVASDRTVLIFVRDPLAAISAVVQLFYVPALPPPGISPRAEVDSSAKLGNDVSIGAFCWVGPGASIGDRAVLFPGVAVYPGASVGAGAVIHTGAVLRERCVVGPGCVIQNGAVIGADGFGYMPTAQGLAPVPQVGITELAAKVDVGANACVDRAAFGRTAVGAGSKLDNLVQVGHNVKIGSHAILCGQAGIAGSTKIGDRVVIGGNAGVTDHVEIAAGTRIAAMSGVTGSIRAAGDYAGYPAIPAGTWRRAMAVLRSLPERLGKRGIRTEQEG